ncbi:MAG: DUF2304 domain-containing protein [Eubacteriales bacterium]|nr:DUF2304 domain-containing protein [Eubacteriales bacterium]
MSIALRVVLLATAVLTFIFMLRRIRRSKLQIESALFWILFSLLLIVIGLFPGIVIAAANLLGVYSPTNLLFAFLFFVLLVKLFTQTMEISVLQEKLLKLSQRIALDNYEEQELLKEKDKH